MPASRAPSNPRQPRPSPNSTSSAMYYPTPHSGPLPPPPNGQMPPPPPGMNHHVSPHMQQQQYFEGMYPGYGRAAPPNTGWNGGGMPPDGYHSAMAGPSRPSAEVYHPYPQTHRSSPSIAGAAGGRHGPHPPLTGSGWSSVHPGANPMNTIPPHPRGSGGVAVKLEDLVSHDGPRNVGPNGQPHNQSQGPGPGPGGLTSVPLSVAQSHSAEAKALAAANVSSSQSGGGGSALVESGGPQPGPSEFIKKLYKMLEEESVLYGRGKAAGAPRGEGAKRGAVGWGKGGASFVVWEMNEFTTKILPQTFRHSNFSSFVRQLNKYGFSKIKHVDEDTGQIKENVWEFQHPNFQAGGKADLDSIKRKAVAPKKGGGELERDGSPSRIAGGLGAEETGRIMEMESRILSLEDRVAKAEEAVQEARNRELGLISLMREVIGQLGNVERETVASPSREVEPSARILRLFQLFEQVAGIPGGMRSQQNVTFQTPVQPQFNILPFGSDMSRFPSRENAPTQGVAHISPNTDGSSRSSGDQASPSGSRENRGQSRLSASTVPDQGEDIIELGRQGNSNQHRQQIPMPTYMPNDHFGLGNTVFADSSWYTDFGGPSAGPFMPINPRKSSDGTTLRLMAEALAAQTQMIHPVNDESQDPLDTTPRRDLGVDPNASSSSASASTSNSSIHTPGINMPTITQSPFGTLIIPPQSEKTQGNGIRLRRSTVFKPSWTQTPKILVVEDDVVYRQLSRKFLEKFGCQIEVVENAQVAIERMNKTKYDLVLMDIFFGPDMDGRKATSLIRQFDMYTPIISMTSNAQPKDVDSYLQSGMNDVLAKPFTSHGLFGILDKHLIHLKAIQLSAEVPRFIGVPPLSDQGIVDAVVTGAAQWGMMDENNLRNPLVGMGWSDETYQLVLQQFMQTGSMPDVNSITNTAIGTNLVFADSAGFNRKRSIESPGDDWMEAEERRDGKKSRNEGTGVVEIPRN